ncbi:MAG TPA: CheB methylesterase domain-containing protein [Anaeromyxobacter sp.]|nr:CheB methylesterase domain-containing protein [Anaeromyxobacter sp.]
MTGGAGGGPANAPVAVIVDDWALAAVPGLDQDLAREGALVMRAFKGFPNPHLLRRYRGAAVVGGPDRTGLLSRLERATSSVAAPVIAILPPGVAPTADLRGPGVVDLVPAGARRVGRRVLLMAGVPVVTAGRAARGAEPASRDPAPAAAPARAGALAAPPGVAGDVSDVVAVASSTGGVWVLAALLREVSREGRAVLVAQHMEPEFVPFFADWLQSASGWRTVLVHDATPLAGGVVYLAAGGRDLVLDREVLRALPASSRFVPCADRLLASAAERGGRVTGLVLSGMGADGAGGLAEIARRGGRALCQEPASAIVPSMPECALRRTPSALALPPAALPCAIGAAQALETSGASARR